jgi:hypothetical protein
MPTKPTGKPNGRPKGSVGKKFDRAGKIFEAAAQMNRTNGFIYNVSVVYDSGAKYYLGVVDTPTSEAIGSKFGGGNFELIKMKRASLEVMGEPIALSVHPLVYEVRFPDPSMARRSGYPGSPFGFLGQGQPQAPAPVATSSDEFERRMKDELTKERERHEDELDAMRAEQDEERDRKEQERRQDDERRSREAFETRILSMLEGKKSGGDDLARTVELVKTLMPSPQFAQAPAPRTDWAAMVTVGMTALSGLLNFGKQVAQTQAAHPVDTADLALQELFKTFAPLAQRFLNPAPVNGGAPAPAPVNEQAEAMSEEQAMQAAFTELTRKLTQSLADKEDPAQVAAWYWEQRGLGWMQVHGYTKSLEPSQLVQAILHYANGLVKSPEEMAHLEFIAEAIKQRGAVAV